MFNQLILNILSVFKATGINQAQGAIKNLGTSFQKFAGQAGMAAGAFAAFNSISSVNEFAQGAIDQAQQLERNLLAVSQVFESEAPKIQNYIKSVEDYGLAQAEAAKATVFIGSVLKQSGFSLQETADLTQTLTTLAVDLATTYGYDVQEALMGMTALFRGEYDPIEKFGVAMKQSEINSELLARKLNHLEGAARRYAEQQIRVELLLSRSSDASGAFSRANDTLYVSTKRLEAAFTNLQAEAGAPLQDVLAELNNIFIELIDQYGPRIVEVFQNLADRFQEALPIIEDFLVIFFEFISSSGGIIDFFGNLMGLLAPLGQMLKMLSLFAQAFGNALEFLGRMLDIAVESIEKFIDSVPFLKAGFEGAKTRADNFRDAIYQAQTAMRGFVNDQRIAAGLIAETDGVTRTTSVTFQGLWSEALARADAQARTLANGVMLLNGALWLTGGALRASGQRVPTDFKFPVKVTPVGAGGKKTDPIKEFFDKLKDDVKKQKAALKLESMGASESVIETILGASDWEAVYKKIAEGGKKALDEVAKLIKRGYDFAQEQKEKLNKLKDDVKDAVTGIADNLLGAFNLKDFGKSSNEVIMNMRKMVERIRAFKDEVTRLAKAGLNPQLLQQILAMGPTEGLSFARALLAGGGIGEMNALYKEATGLALQAGQNIVSAQSNYYITVNGGVGDKKTIGAAIVEAIKAYERTSGTNWRA